MWKFDFQRFVTVNVGRRGATLDLRGLQTAHCCVHILHRRENERRSIRRDINAFPTGHHQRRSDKERNRKGAVVKVSLSSPAIDHFNSNIFYLRHCSRSLRLSMTFMTYDWLFPLWFRFLASNGDCEYVEWLLFTFGVIKIILREANTFNNIVKFYPFFAIL